MSIKAIFRSWQCRTVFARKLTLVAASVAALAGCRLYEPERYDRLQEAPGQTMIRVLMIGDSLTYYNDMPGLVQQLSAHEEHPIYIEKITFPLAPLSQHWNANTRNRIREGQWDYVVLQDFSRKPVTDPEDCLKYYELFNDAVTAAGGKSIIFENWTRAGKDDEFHTLMDTYGQIISQTHGIAAPLGTAFRDVRAARPDIRLLLDDRHPTDAGSYLVACVMYDVIYHKKSSDLAWDLKGPKLSREVMGALREYADKAEGVAAPAH